MEQRRHFDKLLVEARLQMDKRDTEIVRLKGEISCLKTNFSHEIDDAAQVSFSLFFYRFLGTIDQ